MKLRWGDPPAEAPVVTKCVPPAKLDNLPGSTTAGDIDFFGVYGIEVPPFRQVQYALRKTRNKFEYPYAVDLGKLGILVVGEEGWELR